MDPDVIRGLLGLKGYGENVEIPRSKLVVPEEFQRQLKPRNWETFIPALFGRAIVVEVDGKEWLCDGLHRVAEGDAHDMWASQAVPAIRFANGTKEIAAAVFHLGNRDRTSVSQADQFRAACISGDAEARKLDEDLLEIGLDGWCQGRSESNLSAIGTVAALAEKYGRAHALYTLDTINEIWSWEKDDAQYVEASPNIRIIKGFGEYLRPEKRVGGRRRLRKWDPEDREMLTSWIAVNYPGEVGHDSFILKAQFKLKGGGGGGSAVGVEMVIHDCFLAARREQRDAA
jgi:hypothetical protein